MPRPRFTLRVLFVAMTLHCVWCGYSVNWIQQRRAALNDGWVVAYYEPGVKFPAAPGLLWIFAEPAQQSLIVYRSNGRPNSKERAAKLFPESQLTTGPWQDD